MEERRRAGEANNNGKVTGRVEEVEQADTGETAATPAQADWREYVAGWGSSIVNICVTFPVNKTMFRQQLQGISALSAFKQLRSEVFTSNIYLMNFFMLYFRGFLTCTGASFRPCYKSQHQRR